MDNFISYDDNQYTKRAALSIYRLVVVVVVGDLCRG